MITLADEQATRAAGAVLGTVLAGGDAIALVGDLGAGKTTLVSGLVAALGAGTAASPTFSLIHEYVGGRLIVWHVDLYRIERAAELVELGLDDIVGDRRGVCVIEWADKFAVTPAQGLEDRYLGAGGKLGRGPWVDRLSWTLAWHDFRAARGGADYGHEWNASLGTSFGHGWSGLVKLADYRSEGFARDTQKLWLQLEWMH